MRAPPPLSTGVLEFSETVCVLYFVFNNIPFLVRTCVFGVHACPVNFWGISNPLKHETAVLAMYAHNNITPASGLVSHQPECRKFSTGSPSFFALWLFPSHENKTFRAPKGPLGNVLPSVVDSYMRNTRDSRQRPDYTCAFFAHGFCARLSPFDA